MVAGLSDEPRLIWPGLTEREGLRGDGTYCCVSRVARGGELVARSGFDTVLTGAGISFEAPSNLPSGEELAAAAWEVLAQTVGLPSELVDDVTHRIQERALRLEQLLDVMTFGGNGVPLEVLVTAYVAVESDAYNSNHERLSYLPGVHHFTVNMDTLLEIAAETRGWDIHITHLHGRWNHPGEISTTISQYLAELDPTLEREFGDAINDKNVLVAGYSARDRDIQPLFLKFPPASLTWLVYPKAGRNPTDADAARRLELEPEAMRLLDALRDSGRTYVHERRTTIGEFLAAPPPAVSLPARASFSRGTNGARVPMMRGYARVEDWRRRLAIAAVLADQGMGDRLAAVLDPIRIPPEHRDARIAAAKLRARILRRQGHRAKALWTLIVPVGHRGYLDQLKAVANEVSATLPGTRLHWLADPFDRALVMRADGKTKFLISTRVAQRESARGELRSADAMLRELGQRFSRREVGLGNWVNYLTWYADVLKMLGQVDDARRILQRDIDETFYSDQAQSAALEWKLLELALVSEGPTPETLDGLRVLEDRGPDAIGVNQHCWVQLTLVGATGTWSKSLERAARQRADTEMFFYLQRAEVARASGDFIHARRLVRRALRVERDRGRWQGARTGRLAGKLILATLEGQLGSERAATDLQKLARDYERIGADLPAARAHANAAIACGQKVPDNLVEKWSEMGWAAEARRARDSDAGLSDAWQIVM